MLIPSGAVVMLNVTSVTGVLSGIDPGILWGAGVVAALAYSLRMARRGGLDPRVMYWTCTLAIVSGQWGGHLLGIYYYGTDGHPWAWLRFWSGGRAEYGSFLTGLFTATIYLRVRKQSFLRYMDAIAPAVALGVAISRLGCFLNGDDFGTRTTLPWAVTFPPGTEAYADHFNRGWISATAPLSLPVHPVQLYAALFALALFVFLSQWHPSRSGQRFSAFLVIYSAGRFLDQYLRGDFQSILGPLSLTQVISLVLMFAGLFLFKRSATVQTFCRFHGGRKHTKALN